MSSTPFTVLMVDDSPVITEMYSAYLRHAGYKVEIATDGLEALEKRLQRIEKLLEKIAARK